MGSQAEGSSRLRLVVSDTGPLLHLGEADALIFLSWTGEVSIPKAVDREMSLQNPLWQSQRPAWIRVHELAASYKVLTEAKTALNQLFP